MSNNTSPPPPYGYNGVVTNNSVQQNSNSYILQQIQLQNQFQQQLQQQQVQQQNNNSTGYNIYQQQHITQLDQYLTKLYDKFQSFSNFHLGIDNVNFERYPMPTPKQFSSIVVKIGYQQHIHTSLLPFMLGSDVYQPPPEFTKVDVVQYYIDGIAALLVLNSLGPQTYQSSRYGQEINKRISIYLAKCLYLIDKLNNEFKKTQTTSGTGNAASITADNNAIVQHFNKEIENIKLMIEYVKNGKPSNQAYYYFAKTLFSILCSKGYFWTIDEANELVKLPHYAPIKANLHYLSNLKPDQHQLQQDITTYKYSFGCFSYSFFKIYQSAYGIDSQRFFNYKSKKTFDEQIYNDLLTQLKQSNDLLSEAFNQPNPITLIWLTYAKTCCLLDFEDKAHIWIQYFINEAFDRVRAFELINNDSDIAHYHSKPWYIEIGKSIEVEKARLINEQLDKSIGAYGGFEQYLEVKQNLIMEGFSVKNMNQDSSLISSNILWNLHPPPQSEQVKIAQKRLSERLELYMLKNSKEIPGDGNCQFHALSDQLYGDLLHSQEIRKTIVQWLRKNKDFALPNGANLSQFVNFSDWDVYCNEMEKNGNWGDHLTLLAAAEIYACKVSIISSVESTSHFFIDVIPTKIQKDKVLLLSHYAEFHYGSLCFNN